MALGARRVGGLGSVVCTSRRRTPLRASRRTVNRATGASSGEQAPSFQPSPQSSSGPAGISVQGYSPTSPRGWHLVKQALRDANVKLLSAQEVLFAAERGVPIIDVRPAADFAKGHIPGSINVPFYQPIEGWEPMKVARRVGFALFGVLNGTEVNPNFSTEAMALVDPKQGAILVCALGGTLEPVEGSKKGLQSRSLIAAWQLLASGCSNISVMKGGFNEWVKGGRDVAELVEEA